MKDDTPTKANVRFPDADGKGEWLEVEVHDLETFTRTFIEATFLNAQRKGKFDRDPEG